MLYEVLDPQTGVIYRAQNVADLREIVEANIELDNLPSNYTNVWSNSRCITYLIQMGYIIPYGGPDWFMAIRPTQTGGDDAPLPRRQTIATAFIQDDGTVGTSGRVEVTFWQERNHVRLVFLDKGRVLGEVFLTEDGLRKLFMGLGEVVGFNRDSIFANILQLPPALLHTPETLPERYHTQEEGTKGFNIFEAVGSLDLDFSFADNTPGTPQDDNMNFFMDEDEDEDNATPF